MGRRFSSPFWFFAPGLLAVLVISYGALAAKLGFYWDDWTIVWYLHFLGPSSFHEAFASDRPLLAWIYQLTTPLMGESPLNWQMFAILTRWLAGCALWWALDGLWPDKPLQTAAAAVLFSLYPGFQQQHIAITYGNAFVVLAIYLASWGSLIWGLRIQRWFKVLYPLSILSAAYAVFTAEHFFGLELLRPILIWLALRYRVHSDKRVLRRLQQTVFFWLPFLVIDTTFLSWRLSHPTPRAEITLFERIQSNPLQTLLSVAQTAVQDMLTAGIEAWLRILDFSWIHPDVWNIIRNHLLVFFAAFLLSGFMLWFINRHNTSENLIPAGRKWGMSALLIGLFALFAAGIPIWPTNLRIALDFPWDRFTLPSMLGAALLLTGLVETTSIFRFQNIFLVSLICGLSAGFHYQNALSFRSDWLAQRDFFWQLTWRMPGIQPGTVLLTTELPFAYEWDNSLTAPLNWVYAPDFQGRSLPYLMYDIEGRLSSGLPSFVGGSEIFEEHRITPFYGSTDQAISLIYQPPGTCLKVINPEKDQYLPDKPRYFREISKFSDLTLIQADRTPGVSPPSQFFSPEPDPSWCTYFEKAELALQTQDWAEIVRLGDIAFVKSPTFNRRNAVELTPFIEGYARAGIWEKAYLYTLQANQASEKLTLPLCAFYEELQAEPSMDAQDHQWIAQAVIILNCEQER